jgi:tetratricopeptide (TPR) repeat protein
MGDYKGSLDCFEEALILDPSHAKTWNYKGIALQSLAGLFDFKHLKES